MAWVLPLLCGTIQGQSFAPGPGSNRHQNPLNAVATLRIDVLLFGACRLQGRCGALRSLSTAIP